MTGCKPGNHLPPASLITIFIGKVNQQEAIRRILVIAYLLGSIFDIGLERSFQFVNLRKTRMANLGLKDANPLKIVPVFDPKSSITDT